MWPKVAKTRAHLFVCKRIKQTVQIKMGNFVVFFTCTLIILPLLNKLFLSTGPKFYIVNWFNHAHFWSPNEGWCWSIWKLYFGTHSPVWGSLQSYPGTTQSTHRCVLQMSGASRFYYVFKGFNNIGSQENSKRQRGNTCGMTQLQRLALLPSPLRSTSYTSLRFKQDDLQSFTYPNVSLGTIVPLQSNGSTGMFGRTTSG